MSDFVNLQLRELTYAKLKRLAILSGDESTAIERLIAHWESTNPTVLSTKAERAEKVEHWHSSSGDVLPVGAVLQGRDWGKVHEAVVDRAGIKYDGEVYTSLSAAAAAVKHARGLTGTSANTDGRKFWQIRDAKTNRWIRINSLRPGKTVAEMLKEIDAL
jgi:hypothetical protein